MTSYLGINVGVFRDVNVLIWIGLTESIQPIRPTSEDLSFSFSFFRALPRLQPDALQAALKPGDDSVIGEDRCLEQALGFLDQPFEKAAAQAM